MARFPTSRKDDRGKSFEHLRQGLEPLLPNERDFVYPVRNTRFEIADANTVLFRFDPAEGADSHDVQWSNDPNFRNPNSKRVFTGSNVVQVPLGDGFTCDSKYYFRVQPLKGRFAAEWSPVAVFKTPYPGPLIAMTALHAVDNVQDENPIINVNITLPRTAVVGSTAIADHEALWTDHVDVEADWSTIPLAITDLQTEIVVAAGTAGYFKVSGFYKVAETGEILSIDAVDTGTDTLTVGRGALGTERAATGGAATLRLYVRLLREQFSAAANGGLYAVTLTIPNPEKVRTRVFEAWAVGRCGTRSAMSTATATLAAAPVIADLVATPLFQLIELSWSELDGAYRYEVYHSTTGAINIGDPDPTTTAGTELLARPLADHQGIATYPYHAEYDAGVVHYFGVRAVDIFGEAAGGDLAGPLQPDATTSNPADDVTDITATEGPALEPGSFQSGRDRSRTATNKSMLTMGFEAPDPVGTFARCKIYEQPTGDRGELASGITAGAATATVSYDDAVVLAYWRYFTIDSEVIVVTSVNWASPGSGVVTLSISRGQFGSSAASHSSGAAFTPYVNPQPIAEGATGPLSQIGPPIGQVTLYFVSVALTGEENAVLSSPNLSIDRDGQTSAPLEVQNLRGIKTQSGGKVFWSEGLEPDLRHYEVADLGSRQLEAQDDIEDQHIVARVAAIPGGLNRAMFEWQEVEYEGEISQGSSSVVLGRVSAAIKQLTDNRFDPIGTVPVAETLRFSRSSRVADLTSTDYTIDSNDDDTIHLDVAPDEADNDDVVVSFHIGGRFHKFYVRAVNDSGLASEWRPVEGTFLELSATAPDGTRDVGVPTVYDVGIPIDPTGFDRASWYCGRGKIWVQAAARGANEAESDFDLALKQNIGGVNAWEVRVTPVSGNVLTVQFPGFNDRDFYEFLPVIPIIRLNSFWKLSNRSLPPIDYPNIEVSLIELRARNWFGWSPWATVTAQSSNSSAFTGNGGVEPSVDQAIVASALTPNIGVSRRRSVTLDENITLNSAVKGGSDDPELGQEFHITIIQDATGGRTVTFDSSYIGVTAGHVNPAPNAYTILSFIPEDDGGGGVEFRLSNVFSSRIF